MYVRMYERTYVRTYVRTYHNSLPNKKTWAPNCSPKLSAFPFHILNLANAQEPARSVSRESGGGAGIDNNPQHKIQHAASKRGPSRELSTNDLHVCLPHFNARHTTQNALTHKVFRLLTWLPNAARRTRSHTKPGCLPACLPVFVFVCLLALGRYCSGMRAPPCFLKVRLLH